MIVFVEGDDLSGASSTPSICFSDIAFQRFVTKVSDLHPYVIKLDVSMYTSSCALWLINEENISDVKPRLTRGYRVECLSCNARAASFSFELLTVGLSAQFLPFLPRCVGVGVSGDMGVALAPEPAASTFLKEKSLTVE